jgi:hypothetical protein
VTDDLVRLISHQGADEVNHAGTSYRVTPWNTVLVHPDAVAPLQKTGGFTIAAEADELIRHSTLSEVHEAVWALPKGRVRSTLLALLTNTNLMNYVVQSAGPKTRIV